MGARGVRLFGVDILWIYCVDAGIMKTVLWYVVCLLLACSTLVARTWTNDKGQKIEADVVSATDTHVTLLMGDKNFEVALTTLSEDDQAYVADWLKQKKEKAVEAQAAVASGKLTFDGQELATGGKLNKYEFEYDAERLERVQKKHKSDDTGYRIAIAVPDGFDPSKPQKVFIPSTAVNNAKQGLAGNFSVVGFYAKNCVNNGWVCLTFDTNLGRKNHDEDLLACFEKLNEVWPGIRDWEFAVGGFSGGGKACWWPCAYLIKNDYKVIGAMLSGVNEDMSQNGRKEYGASKAGYKDIKILLSNGKWDEVAQVAKQEDLEKSLNRNGMRNIRKEMHDGKHNLDYGQIDIALKWFNEAN